MSTSGSGTLLSPLPPLHYRQLGIDALFVKDFSERVRNNVYVISYENCQLPFHRAKRIAAFRRCVLC